MKKFSNTIAAISAVLIVFSASISGAHLSDQDVSKKNKISTITTADGQKAEFSRTSEDGRFMIFISKSISGNGDERTREIIRAAADINKPLLDNDKFGEHDIRQITFSEGGKFVIFDLKFGSKNEEGKGRVIIEAIDKTKPLFKPLFADEKINGYRIEAVRFIDDDRFAIFSVRSKEQYELHTRNFSRMKIEIIRATDDINTPLLPDNKINGHEINRVIFSKEDGRFVIFLYSIDLGNTIKDVVFLRAIADITKPLLPNDKIDGHDINDVEFSKDGRFVSLIYFPDLRYSSLRVFVLRAIDKITNITKPLLPNDQIDGHDIHRIEFSPDEVHFSFVDKNEHQLVTKKATDLLKAVQ